MSSHAWDDDDSDYTSSSSSRASSPASSSSESLSAQDAAQVTDFRTRLRREADLYMDTVRTQVTRASELAKASTAKARGAASETWESVAPRLVAETARLRAALDEASVEKAALAARLADRGRAATATMIREQVHRGIGLAVDRTAERLKVHLTDDSMPRFVVRAIHGVVDDVVPDVKAEIVDQVLRRDVLPVDVGEPSAAWNVLGKLRNWILYVLYPYDRTIWDQLRDPAWYVLMLILAFPRFGVHVVAWCIILVVMDKRDEYRLIDFILTFKGFQFFSMGFLQLFMGAARFYACIHGTADCIDVTAVLEPWEMAAFVFQMVLVWVAFLLLPCSEKRGGRQYRKPLAHEEAEEEERSCCCCCVRYGQRGGSLPSWMLYEFFLVLLVAGACVLAVLYTDDVDGPISLVDPDTGLEASNDWWYLRSNLYWIRCLYGLLSLPFLVFRLPLMMSVLTKAKETGYTRNGKCVRILLKRERVEERAMRAAGREPRIVEDRHRRSGKTMAKSKSKRRSK